MISLYGITISLAIASCLWISSKVASIENKDKRVIWDLAPTVIIFAVIGARLYHVLDYFDYYMSNPVQILFVWKGGLGIIGGIMGGVLAIYLYARTHKMDLIPWLDISFLSLPLGQAIGRIGNLINKENFGTPTSLPWGQYIAPQNRPSEYRNYAYFHPAYIYEAILDLLLFVIIYFIYKKKRLKVGSGDIFYSYLIGYSLIRFFLEFIRVNTWHIGSLNIAQLISILVLIASSYKLFYQKK